ncbi:MAG: GNAT family N-acetyltransferase [Patescibacteria group bacterium]|nr:GNAT family N-acetyltransferase [Patescibacteria group bacterium]
MDRYLTWDEKTITDFSDANVSALYERGFVFTRLGKGQMAQTRSVRVDLNKFELTSENRRVLKKTENVRLNVVSLPHPNYDWRIHKMGFDFYTTKFGPGTFSANKIKELLISENSNFNLLFKYSLDAPKGSLDSARDDKNEPVGYCICYTNSDWLHYAYPFYDLNVDAPNLGISMMTKAIVWAKENGKKYVCLGSAKDAAAIYKFQFSGVEWFDGKEWKTDVEELKKILK